MENLWTLFDAESCCFSAISVIYQMIDWWRQCCWDQSMTYNTAGRPPKKWTDPITE